MQTIQAELYVPSLKELSSVLQLGLNKAFRSVSVSVKTCPDLTAEPFSLTSKGLCGNETLLDIGGVKNLVPLVSLDKKYGVSNVLVSAKIGCPCFTVGAGAGPFHVVGKNSECVVDCTTTDSSSVAKNRIISLDEKNENSIVSIDKSGEFALMMNLFASDGQPGEVLEIVCENRLSDGLSDDENFANTIRKILVQHYGEEKPVALGGAIFFERGTARLHVMPDFSKTPLDCGEKVNSWLKFFEMEAPLVALGELVSHDPGFDLRVEHFHCFKPGSSTDGGHFHTDTTPRTAKYRAYFNVAKRLVRVDKP